MTRLSIRRTTLLLACALVVMAIPGPGGGLAFAQTSDSDLRKQNQQLQAQIQELQKQLKAAQESNKQLEDRVKQLTAAVAAARQSPGAATPIPPLEPEKVTIDETKPDASPRALFKAIVASYEKNFADIDMGKVGDGKRHAFMKRLEGWKTATDREFRSPVIWHVKAIDSRMSSKGDRIGTFVAIDPETHVQLGDSFDIVLSKLLADRLAWWEQHGDLEHLVLRGIVAPSIRINDQRDSRGSFDKPPFIGPFAEFEYFIEVKSIVPAKEDAEQNPPVKPATTKPADVKTMPAKKIDPNK